MYNLGREVGKAEGYLDGYKKGIRDGNPFNALVEACARVGDSIRQIMTDPAVLDAIDRINKEKEVKKTCSLCGWCQTSDNPEDPEDALVCANGACEHCGRLLGTLNDPIEVENCEGFEEPL